jgi:hypothetical protein
VPDVGRCWYCADQSTLGAEETSTDARRVSTALLRSSKPLLPLREVVAYNIPNASQYTKVVKRTLTGR